MILTKHSRRRFSNPMNYALIGTARRNIYCDLGQPAKSA
jgi:hypothetical protein